MTPMLRIVLIVASALLVLYTLFKIRRAQLDIDDTVFWLILPLLLLVLSIFPEIAYFFSEKLGFISPANFIFLAIVFLLLFKLFLVSVDLSVQKRRLNRLVQVHAIAEEEREEEALAKQAEDAATSHK